MLRLPAVPALIAAILLLLPADLRAVETLLHAASVAEAALDSREALQLLREADARRPDDPVILQRIARQYSDLEVDLTTPEEKRSTLARALEYARRAEALAPRNAEAVLSVGICLGKLATYGDAREKVALSRQVRTAAERALALDPHYAWAHHVLGRWHHEVISLGSARRLVVRLFLGALPDASAAAAVHHLERAVALEPAQLQHQLELGFAYLVSGDAAKARAAFQAGLAMPSRDKHDAPAKARARAALAPLDAAAPHAQIR